MKLKLDLSKFKMKHRDEKVATLVHPSGHEFRIAVKALHPENRKNLDLLKLADGGDVEASPQDKRKAFQDSFAKRTGGDEQTAPSPKQTPRPSDTEARNKRTDEHTSSFFSRIPNHSKGGEIKSQDDDIISEKQITDDYNNLHEDEPKEYSPAVQKRMRETDVTPRQYADGTPSIQPQDGMQPALDQSQPAAPQDLPGMPIAPSPAALEQQTAPTLPQSPQMPAASLQAAPQGMPVAGPQEDPFNAIQGFKEYASAQRQQGDIQAKMFKDQAALAAGQQAGEAEFQAKQQEHEQQIHEQNKALRDDIQAGHIDPNHFLGSKDTTSRIGIGIGLILGGMGGQGQGNQALDFLNKQIDHDIEAQKANLGKKETLLSANMRELGDSRAAAAMTRIQMNDLAMSRMEQARDKAMSQMAKTNADTTIANLKMQNAPLIQQMALRQTIADAGKQGKPIDQDPATLIANLVPKEHQNDTFKEVERAQNVAAMRGNIFQVARKAIDDLKPWSGKALAMVKEPRALQELKALMGQTVTDLTGTAKQAEFDVIYHTLLPRPGDTDKELEARLPALDKYLSAKASAPIFKQYVGADIHNFKSTAPAPTGQRFTHPNGEQYQKTDGGFTKVK